MPNTLAHIGAQGLTTRLLLKDADPKWIYIGLIIPDIPWILNRMIPAVYSGDLPYELNHYITIQASLFFCLLLSSALASLTSHFWKTFSILGLNSFLHLFLDACETKWGNGVHLLAPIDWKMINFGFFWPESLPIYLLTLAGLVFIAVNWRQSLKKPADIRLTPHGMFISISLFAAYLSLPFLMFNSLERADSHFLKTMNPQLRHERPGHYVEFDRVPYIHNPSGGLILLGEEEITVEGVVPDRTAIISVRGTFMAEDRIRIREYHINVRWFRSGASYLALFLVALLWIYAAARQKACNTDLS